MSGMRKLRNPYSGIEGYSCFGCAPDNEHGLRMEFFEDGDELVSAWEPVKHFHGYGDVLHGGIQATLMDEIGGWFVNSKLGTAGVTKNLSVQYLQPVLASKGKITLRASLITKTDRIAMVHVDLFDGEGQVCTSGELEFFMYPEHIAKKRFFFPGSEAFFEE